MATNQIISIQGNIGSGKSTVVYRLDEEQTKDYVCMLEPVNVWSDYQMNGRNILEHFYADRNKFAFPFQMMAFYTRLKVMRQLPRDNLIIMERSVETDKRIFAQMLIDDGSIDPICARIYNEWYSDLVSDNVSITNIYIRTPPEVCLERIGKRGRAGEDVITIEYLTRCHELHERWLLDTAHVVDGTQSSDAIMEDVRRILKSSKKM
jgi:deoxyadenosine/deoxycytidine kinase